MSPMNRYPNHWMDVASERAAAPAMHIRLDTRWLYGALVIALSAWILHGFLQALLAACVTAIASWPLYRRFTARLHGRVKRTAVSLIFALSLSVFVLAPMALAFGAMLAEAHALLLQLASADLQGFPVPPWAEAFLQPRRLRARSLLSTCLVR